jgi:hypothetical protein
MTTVVDPSGTPVPVYNRGGTTIASLAAAGSTQGDAAQIQHVAGYTVVLVTVTDTARAIELPAGAEVGDVVEVHIASTAGTGVLIFPPNGESLLTGNTSATVGQSSGGLLFRKVGQTSWAVSYSA